MVRFRSFALGLLLIAAGCHHSVSLKPLPTAPPADKNHRLAYYAMKQIGVTTKYDSKYSTLKYPGGDVPLERGVCTDVVIRALRNQNVDLQKNIHIDMSAHFSIYPRKWGLSKPDSNIDHRRVENIQCYLHRRVKDQPITDNPEDYAPGDIVTWQLRGGRSHIGIVSLQKGNHSYLIVHNIGGGTQLEDYLFAKKITGHYRIWN